MAFRRRFVRRRAPVYRKRRYLRRMKPVRRRIPKRLRNSNGRYVLRCKYSYQHTITDPAGSSIQFYPKADDFYEFIQLKKNWEAFRFKRFTINIQPNFNVTNPAGPVPRYSLVPYHTHLNKTLTYNDVQSLNNCKTYHGCRTARRSFVPAILSCVRYFDSKSQPDWSGVETKWAPRLENFGSATTVPHYCAVAAFDNNSSTATKVPLIYTITLEATFIMYNQKTNQIE